MRDSHVREIISKLKQDIAARSAESREMASLARTLRGEERHRKQMERRAFGRCTRWRLLAYAWLRARPYAPAERHAVVPVDSYAIRRALEGAGLSADAAEIRRWLRGEARGYEAPAPEPDKEPEEAAPARAARDEEGAACAAGSTS